MFRVQQQILQQLNSINNQLETISFILGLELNQGMTSRIPQNLHTSASTPSVSIPPQTTPTPDPLNQATTIPPQSIPTPGSLSQTTTTPLQSTPRCPGPLTPGSNHIEAATQPKDILLTPSEVISKYTRLRGDSKMGELASKLARESFFGKELMRRSTVMGFKDFPPLPSDRVQTLKDTILSLCPAYQCNPHGFEGVWKKCVDAINHSCSKLRK